MPGSSTNSTQTANPKPALARRFQFVAAGAAAVAVALQVVPAPPRTNPPIIPNRTIQAAMPVPAGVSRLLNRSCADCHSNATRWPFYSRVAPFSWLVAGDVTDARNGMNFSEWQPGTNGADPTNLGKLVAACAAVESGIMPPARYLLLHADARLSAREKASICAWVYSRVAAVE